MHENAGKLMVHTYIWTHPGPLWPTAVDEVGIYVYTFGHVFAVLMLHGVGDAATFFFFFGNYNHNYNIYNYDNGNYSPSSV